MVTDDVNDNNDDSIIKENKDAVRGNCGVTPMEVQVEANNIDRALKSLKRKLIREGVYKMLKQRRFFEKPSEVKKRKKKEAVKKIRKEESKKTSIV